jgi:hypothetical protein
MSFFQKLWHRRLSSITPPPDPPLTQPNYMGAGCIFTDGIHILAGWQPRKRNPGLTGIGGAKNKGETYLTTAYRETLEELLHIKSVSPILINHLKITMKPKKIIESNGYVSAVFDFDDLVQMLKECKRMGITSPVYEKFPTDLMSLLRNRKLLDTTEIEILALLPVVKEFPPKRRIYVRDDLLRDMEKL